LSFCLQAQKLRSEKGVMHMKREEELEINIYWEYRNMH
jgi:hypothetical protein